LNENLLPVKPKPYFIDIAGEAIQYPDLSKKIETGAKS